MNGLSFRFRGRIHRLLTLYRIFQDNPGVGLHPAKIARLTGMSIVDTDDRLRRTPEMFVKLPKRQDGLTRYRLTSAFTAMTQEQAKARLSDLARRESLVLYSALTGIVLIFAIMMILIGPAV